MSPLAKLIMATAATLMLAAPAVAFDATPGVAETPADLCTTNATLEGCALVAAQPTAFCYAETKCTTVAPVKVDALVRFDAAMDAVIAR